MGFLDFLNRPIPRWQIGLLSAVISMPSAFIIAVLIGVGIQIPGVIVFLFACVFAVLIWFILHSTLTLLSFSRNLLGLCAMGLLVTFLSLSFAGLVLPTRLREDPASARFPKDAEWYAQESRLQNEYYFAAAVAIILSLISAGGCAALFFIPSGLRKNHSPMSSAPIVIEPVSTSTSGTMKCPYCAELIQAAAIKCRYCRRMLSEPSK